MDRFIDTEFARLGTENMVEEMAKTETKMYQFNGVWFADTNVQEEVLLRMPAWEARSEDAYVVSYPKAGTTWVQEIMFLAMNNADVERTKTGHTMLRIPYIEANIKGPKLRHSPPLKALLMLWYLLKVMFRMLLFCIKQGQMPVGISPLSMARILPSPRLLKTHLPFQLLPPDIMKKKAKIVYVARNPKDLAVSYFNFHKWMPMIPNYSSWDTYFDDFMAGKLNYGHWYEHYLGFWNRRHEENILFIKYEDMKKDHKAAVTQICDFLGYTYSEEILASITEHTTFSSMKKNPMTNPDSLFPRKVTAEKDNTSFMRKGKVGDWRNYFTDEQSKALDETYKEKLEGTGLQFDF
ncbi:sulfotransferase 1C4-like [Amphiura filiformis]|uniref:sulfotransferase 1C4-like n=1 Tax=Amphiura filiformis TaxID=82378 RepID=UPI003B228A12